MQHDPVPRWSRTCVLAVSMTIASSAIGTAGAQSNCSEYGQGKPRGQLEALPESSGLAASHINPGVLWTHNDSGDGPKVYAIDRKGAVLLEVSVQGAGAQDWEAMEIGPCPQSCACLFLADVGDNGGSRPQVTIYRVPEPVVLDTADGQSVSIDLERALSFTYPDGPHNAEALLVDPLTGIPWILTKSGDGQSIVFRFPQADPVSLPVEVHEIAVLDMTGNGPKGRLVTGGAISADGARLAIRTYKGAWEWTVGNGGIDAVWGETPLYVELPHRKQGEAITYSRGGLSLMTTTEGDRGTIDELACIAGSPVAIPVTALRTVCEDAAILP